MMKRHLFSSLQKFLMLDPTTGGLTILLTAGYYQLINFPTHLTNTSSPCIDLILILNPNLITEFGVGKSLSSDSCHLSVISGKMNLSVPLPPLYTRDVWDFHKANGKNIQISKKPVTSQDFP